jgi:plastocyanin
MNARTIFLLAGCIACTGVKAASLTVMVKDANGTPLPDAVVYSKSSNATSHSARQAVIDQRDKQFIPYVTAVQVGTSVMFPNKDNIRHHVYSLSPAKRFELPLYAGVPAEPVVFDKEGFVTLGCNIHDWMIAYVAVLATPNFQVTKADGRVVLKDLPPGEYTVFAWHPLLKATPEKLAQHVAVGNTGAGPLTFTLDLKPDFRARRSPNLTNGGYP